MVKTQHIFNQINGQSAAKVIIVPIIMTAVQRPNVGWYLYDIIIT